MKKFKKEKILWEEKDPFGRKIKLTSGAYRHIVKCHPRESTFTEKMKETIKFPISIQEDENIEEDAIKWYYFNRIEKEELNLIGVKNPYIILIVKKIRNEFRIVTCYACSDIKKKGAKEIWKREKD